ncbi:YkgJ family cysteine cluster protein [Sphingomonas sp.]|uniref:YkgJ family cysteine cluster protein n=1 Tax=Sphingomonas sp. TaxID=28214 RepID=UPI0025CBE0DE|nr:YkgJ family cysteine cluster protein [Sphingomonas sp.]
MNAARQRFACTQCGKCCNRPPEVELSEAAALSDVFVFSLMFRLYCLPSALRDSPGQDISRQKASEVYYQSKRLLTAFAVSKYPTKIERGGKAVEYTQYLTISALTLDTRPGACNALHAKRCSIYDRRPFACRSVPLHYSRVEALAESDLRAFVAGSGYDCDTSESAPVLLESGRIVDPETQQARAKALLLAERDRKWRSAILRRLKAGASENALPSLHQIKTNAPFGATTTSMRVAWQIAVETGLIDVNACTTLIATQLAVIDRELAEAKCTQDTRETLAEMRAEYMNHSRSAD